MPSAQGVPCWRKALGDLSASPSHALPQTCKMETVRHKRQPEPRLLSSILLPDKSDNEMTKHSRNSIHDFSVTELFWPRGKRARWNLPSSTWCRHLRCTWHILRRLKSHSSHFKLAVSEKLKCHAQTQNSISASGKKSSKHREMQ